MVSRALRSVRLRGLAVTIGVLACGGDGVDPPDQGFLGLQLVLPPGRADGIVMLRVRDGNVLAVQPGAGMEATSQTLANETILIVRGSLSGTVTVARLCLSRPGSPSRYTVEVLRAAAGSAEGYAVRPDATDPLSYRTRWDNSGLKRC